MSSKHFWNFAHNDEGEAVELFFEGPIAEDSWLDDEITPDEFRRELNKCGQKKIKMRVNSPGGDCVAASMIYSAIRDYPGEVVAQIDGMAASAASVVVMAADKVSMMPTAMMMIHDPLTCAFGNADEMKRAMKTLDEVKESIINAYELKTGLSRDKLSKLMSDETWMSAFKARELGFCDEVIGGEATPYNCYSFTRGKAKTDLLAESQENTVSTEALKRRLNLLKQF